MLRFALLFGYLYYMCTYLLLQTVQKHEFLTAQFPVQDVSGGGSRHILMPTVHTSRVSGHLTFFIFCWGKRWIEPREDKGAKKKITTMWTLNDDVSFFFFFFPSGPNTTTAYLTWQTVSTLKSSSLAEEERAGRRSFITSTPLGSIWTQDLFCFGGSRFSEWAIPMSQLPTPLNNCREILGGELLCSSAGCSRCDENYFISNCIETKLYVACWFELGCPAFEQVPDSNLLLLQVQNCIYGFKFGCRTWHAYFVHTEPDTVWLPWSSIVGRGRYKVISSKPCKNLFIYKHIVHSKNVQMY